MRIFILIIFASALCGCSTVKPVVPVAVSGPPEPAGIKLVQALSTQHLAPITNLFYIGSCYYTVKNGVTNGPFCQPSVAKHLILEWNPVSEPGFIEIDQSNDLRKWQPVAYVASANTQWACVIDRTEPQMFWRLK